MNTNKTYSEATRAAPNMMSDQRGQRNMRLQSEGLPATRSPETAARDAAPKKPHGWCDIAQHKCHTCPNSLQKRREQTLRRRSYGLPLSTCMFMCTYTHVCICVYMFACIHEYTQIHMRVPISISLYTQHERNIWIVGMTRMYIRCLQ